MRCVSVYFYFQQRYLNNTNLILKQVLSSPDSSSPAGSDETDLATSGCSSLDGGSLTNMLVVTSSVGMLNGVHSNTTNLKNKFLTLTVLETNKSCSRGEIPDHK